MRTLAVDLPGRGRTPGDLATATIGEWVDSVVADIEDAGLGDIVIVGHSMAGVTVPGVVTKLGSARVREMVLVSAFVPRQGQAIVDTLGGPLAAFARFAARGGRPFKVPSRRRAVRVLQRHDEATAPTGDIEVVHRISGGYPQNPWTAADFPTTCRVPGC